MPANTSPIFTITPRFSWPSSNPIGTLAVTATVSSAYDGTNTNSTLVFSGASNGSFLQKLIFESGGTNSTASVARVFINNGSNPTTATNNSLLMQYSLPTTTASNTQSVGHIELPMMIQIPSSYRVYVMISSSSNLGGGWYVTAVGGDY